MFTQPESRYEVKTVDIGGNFWEFNAEKTYYQMLLGGVDFLLLGEKIAQIDKSPLSFDSSHLILVLSQICSVAVENFSGVLLNNQHVINKEEYDLEEVHTKVQAIKAPSDVCLVLTRLEIILKKIVALCEKMEAESTLKMVFDGRTEMLTFYKS